MRKVTVRRELSFLGYRYQKHFGCGFLLILFAVLVVLGGYFWYTRVFSPLVQSLCEAKANRLGQQTIHHSVAALLAKEEYLGSNFLFVEKTQDGEPSLVLPDTMVMNRFRSELILLISERLNTTKNAEISIPLGNLSGMEFLSNRGPYLTLDAYPYGEVFVELLSEFSDAGVNQTRHAMTVKVTLDVLMALPGHSSCKARVVATVPMSETVVVGSVPNSYTNLETEEKNLKDDLMNLIDE